MPNTLPEVEKLYFYGTGVFDTGFNNGRAS